MHTRVIALSLALLISGCVTTQHTVTLPDGSKALRVGPCRSDRQCDKLASAACEGLAWERVSVEMLPPCKACQDGDSFRWAIQCQDLTPREKQSKRFRDEIYFREILGR